VYGVRHGIGRTVTVLEAGVGHVGRELHRLEHSRRHRRYLESMTTNNESNDIEIQFLYFDGCANAAQTRENLGAALDELGLDIEPEVIDVDPSTFDGPFLGSPSVLVNGVDVYTGSVPDAFEFSCRTFEIDGERTGSIPASLIRKRIESALGR
jgi:hypothetical protein